MPSAVRDIGKHLVCMKPIDFAKTAYVTDHRKERAYDDYGEHPVPDSDSERWHGSPLDVGLKRKQGDVESHRSSFRLIVADALGEVTGAMPFRPGLLRGSVLRTGWRRPTNPYRFHTATSADTKGHALCS